MVELNREFLLKEYGKELVHLTSIVLSYCQIKRIDSNTFKQLTKLEELKLSNNELEEIDVILFESLPNLKVLKLYNNKLKRIDSNTFKQLSKLQSLDFSDNAIEEIDVKLFESLSNLKQLALSNNKLKRIDSNTFKQLTKLEELILSGNEIEEIDVRLFESLSYLKLLYLHSNELKEINRRSFEKLTKLEKLSLRGNAIEEIDVRLFESLSNLKELYLFNNKLKRIDSNTFRQLTKLEKLWLSNNEIEEIDVRLFESLLNLKELYLHNNKLKEINRKSFETLKSTKVISLYGNDLKVLSFYNRSESDKRINYWSFELETIDYLKKYGFKTNWSDFLQQFPESKSTSFFKRDPLIGQSIHTRYKVKDVLGEGSFGKVYLVQDQDVSNNLEKAIKTMKKGIKSIEQAQSHKNEVELMKRIKHDNIILFYENFDETISGSQYFCFVCEFCENGDLQKQIDKARTSGKKFPEFRIIRWICEATSGLKYLHSENIIHRDIKPANILLSKHNVIKLADFGLSKYMESSVAWSLVGSRAYMSPELIQCFVDVDATYTIKTDIWSLGCVLYELINLKIGFPSGMKKGSPLPDFGTSRFARFLKTMLEIKEERRINARDLYDMLSAERTAMEEELS